MKDDLTYLSKLAEKATKGEWIAVGRWVENERDDLPDIVTNFHERGPNDGDKQMCADAEYIAAANPKTIRSMISEIRSLRKLLSKGCLE